MKSIENSNDSLILHQRTHSNAHSLWVFDCLSMLHDVMSSTTLAHCGIITDHHTDGVARWNMTLKAKFSNNAFILHCTHCTVTQPGVNPLNNWWELWLISLDGFDQCPLFNPSMFNIHLVFINGFIALIGICRQHFNLGTVKPQLKRIERPNILHLIGIMGYKDLT